MLSTGIGSTATGTAAASPPADTMLTTSVSTSTPRPGETIGVRVSGCTADVGSVAAVSLLWDTTLLASVFPITPEDDGTFQVDITVPAEVPTETALVLRVVCGDGEVVVAGSETTLTVTASGTPTTTAVSTTVASPISAGPRFTG